MKSSSNEVALVLRRLAEMLEAGGSAIVRLSGETIFIPNNPMSAASMKAAKHQGS